MAEGRQIEGEEAQRTREPFQEILGRETGRIWLPSLIPVKRVGGPNASDEKGGDLKEKKLLRRRLNSEDEKSLISFSKMKKIFGGKEKAERKQSLNEGFQNPRRQRKSQVIFDLTCAKRKSSTRKKSEDLGGRVRTRNSVELFELRNKSESSIRKGEKQVEMVSSIRVEPKLGTAHEKQERFNEPSRGRKRTRKESEQGCEFENENTKGSSFNTDKENKNRGWVNNLFENSESEARSQKEGKSKGKVPKKDFNFQESLKRAYEGKMKETAKRDSGNVEGPKGLSRRKSSFVSLRRESIAADKSDNENISENIVLESNMGSTYRRQPMHLNIGSQISEESERDSELEMECFNVRTFRGEDGESSDLQWQIRVLNFLENPKHLFRSRRPSEAKIENDFQSKKWKRINKKM